MSKLRILFIVLMWSIFLISHGTVNAQDMIPTERDVKVPYEELSFDGLARSISWSPDSQFFALTLDNDLWIYTPDLTLIEHWQGHTDRIFSVDWNADGTRIATSSEDGTISIWDAEETSATYGTTLVTWTPTKEVYSVKWSPVLEDSRLSTVEITDVITGSEGAWLLTTINIWDVDTQRIIFTFPTEYNMSNVVWSPDGQYITYASLLSTGGYGLRLWDLDSKQLISEYSLPIKRVGAISWQPYGSQIAYVDDQNWIGIVEILEDGSIVGIDGFYLNESDISYSVAWNAEGTEIISSGTTKFITIWNPTEPAVKELSPRHNDDIYYVTWSPDSRYITSVSRDNILRVWDMMQLR